MSEPAPVAAIPGISWSFQVVRRRGRLWLEHGMCEQRVLRVIPGDPLAFLLDAARRHECPGVAE